MGGINATVLVQVLTFALLVWAMKRLLWDPMMRQMAERARRLAGGAAAAERGRKELELAERRAREVRAQAHAQADRAITRAEQLGAEIAETLTAQARAEANRLLEIARLKIDREAGRAQAELRERAGQLAVAAAGRLLDARPRAGRH